jgi:hypothetical protein
MGHLPGEQDQDGNGPIMLGDVTSNILNPLILFFNLDHADASPCTKR